MTNKEITGKVVEFFYGLLLLLLFGSISAKAASNPDNVQIKVYSFEDNLSHRNVYKIAQDPWGFIWVATINGLNRFDGKTFTPYFNSLEEQFPLSHEFISDMTISSDTLIWLSIADYVVVLDPRTNKSHKIQVSEQSMVYDKNRSFNCLYTDHKNRLWTAAYLDESGHSFIQKTNGLNEVNDVLDCPGTFAKRPIIQKGQYFFVGYQENKIRKITEDGQVIQEYELPAPDFNHTVGWATQLQVSADGRLWVLQNNGLLYFLEPNEESFRLHPISERLFGNRLYHTFSVEPDGDIWVGGRGTLWFFDDLNEKLYDYHQNIEDLLQHTCTIRQIFVDATGIIWLATDYGVIKLLQNNDLFTNYLNEGSEHCAGACSLRGITGDGKGNIYFSYYNSIHVLDQASSTVSPLFAQKIFFNPPFGLLYHENHLYTGNGKKINLDNLEVSTIVEGQTTDLGALMVDKEGHIWMGYENRLYQYYPTQDLLTLYVDPKNQIDTSELTIAHLSTSKEGKVWMSTMEDGIYQLDPKLGTLAHFNTDNKSPVQLKHNKINQSYEDNRGQLWLATGAGLHRINLSDQSLRVYTSEDGLPNDFINAFLFEGDSVIWITTDNGLSRFNILDQTFTNFHKKDGLPANEFNRMSAYKAPDGRMFFGGMHGVTAFYPGQEFLQKRERKEGKIFFTGFSKLDGKYDSLINMETGLNGKEIIRLTHQDKFFKFEFGLANFENPVENLYSYRLEPYDAKWSPESRTTEAQYGIIPAGNYTFRVRAKAGKGFWNQEQLALKVQVEQAYYKTWWFMILMGLLGVLMIYGLVFWRVYYVQQRRNELEREVKARTQELSDEKKKSDDLLLNILPAETAEELKAFGKARAKRYDSATVFFSDFKDFTIISEQLEPEKLVADIDHCFRAYDEIMEKFGIEKIKTVGDAYMCAGGIPTDNRANAVTVVKAALEIQEFMAQLAQNKLVSGELFFETRIGIHTGPVVAGIVGIKKFAFDIWGDTVNIAARLEDNSEVGKVNISQSTYELVKDHFHCTYRGKITAKNKGEIDMYFVDGLKG